jgi:hypothetical protein
MTTPCRSDCPAGNCAGCAFPPRAQCVPAQPCRQSAACARHDARRCDPREQPIDASLLRHTAGAWCPMFVDARGAMLEAA